MKPFQESDRYSYNLTPDSCVMDIGGYEGNFAFEINRKYGCRVWVFEPAIKFYENIKGRFKDNAKIEVINAAIGDCARIDKIGIRGDSTGFFSDGEVETVVVMPIELALSFAPRFQLAKVNCEGGEFEIMEAVLRQGLAIKVENWQIQPHAIVPNAQQRWDAIMAGLSKTHDLVFDAPWCWAGFAISDRMSGD